MNSRLKQFLAAENISQAQFADNINVVRASVSHVLSGRNNPSYEFIKSIMLKYPSLNIEWLMFGKGKMYKDSTQQGEEISLFDSQYTAEEPLQSEKEMLLEAEPEIEPEIAVPTVSVSQRKVSKIIVLFDDGTYQEM